ncbi:MAG: hypothetical protein GF383_07130 [Candidatus Lokiarchaeota archaeon]|nr:hypothetical protein [Candidatus Lokiarchaeota archaeon]MBD3339940.1 hypothetical protein [Candidatus Lokiarchaeota archaeon]
MCNNCNCENYEKCSIVGYMPVGFCCSRCDLYDERRTCLKMQTKRGLKKPAKSEEVRPISTSIENGILKVVIGKENEEIPIFIDLQKQLGS